MASERLDHHPGLLHRLRKVGHLRLLTQRRFGLYTLGNGISLTGSWMQRIALIWLVWEMTGSGFWLGMLATADMLPILVVGPLAGAVADRKDRLKLTRLCQYVLAGIAALLGILLFFDLLNLPVLMALAAANGSMIALSQPARMALVQSLVSREDVGSAVALSSVNINLARLTGPAIAGIMIVHFDVELIFLANALLTICFVALLGLIQIDPLPVRQPEGSVFTQIRSGVIFAFGDRGIRLLLLLLFLGGAGVRSVQELFPAFAENNFASAATGLAFLTSSMAVGAIAAGLTFGVDTSLNRLVRKVATSWALGAAALAALVASGSAMLDTALALIIGFFVTRSVIGTQTFVQLRAPDSMRGRTLSVHGLISRGSPALGALGTGWAFDHVGLTLPVLFATGLVLLAVIAGIPAMRALGNLEPGDG
ncbi:MFS transporter [Chelativorans salis]|uniref:MFS transporter n=1 Tax=Chelativorans salis TaxID=2978478 RepID=A0ABT2LU74_9HYPH|nr:MFS transporter [Chelativorans sp. EGI FJ00035]MCT7376744.1 MFS transporter [Chelativorans sp. EGI FJ00035]